MPTPAAPEPEPIEKTRFLMSYAFDVSKYADFVVEASTPEEAEKIAKSLLKSEFLPKLLDWKARECDNGSDNLRIFWDGGEDKEEVYNTLPEIAEMEEMDMPEGWETPAPEEQPIPEETPEPAPVLDAAGHIRAALALLPPLNFSGSLRGVLDNTTRAKLEAIAESLTH